MEAITESIYKRIGGPAAIEAAVELFYIKVSVHEEVSIFFREIDMNIQKKELGLSLTQALGDMSHGKWKNAITVHKHLATPEKHGFVMAGLLSSSLEDIGVEKNHIMEVLKVILSKKIMC